MPTLAGIEYTHLIDGFSKGIDQTSPFVRVIYKIDSYEDSNDFANALMGFGSSTGPISGITVTRGVPHACPLSTNLFAHSATVIEGLGQPILNSNGFPQWDGGALIQVEYRPAPFDFAGGENPNHQIDPTNPQTWCTQELSWSSETKTISSAATVPASIPASITIHNLIMTLTYHKLPYLPMGLADSVIGCVNSTQFLGAAAGLVIFRGPDTHRDFNTDGSVVQEVKMTFAKRPAAYPWNSGPSRLNPYTFVPVKDSNNNPPFRTADLNVLLNL
jgi:hypothetical protein